MKETVKNQYEICDIDESTKGTYCLCLEDWSEEMKASGDRKCRWYESMKDKGLGVKLIKDETGIISGMIQYVPAAYSPLEGEDFYYIYCIWVHGYKEGAGDKQKKGLGTALLEAAEEDIASRGASGIAAWGITLPFWMRAAWYRKHGYEVIQKKSMAQLVWKPLKPDAVPPRWYEQKDMEIPETGVVVTSIVNGICPGMNLSNLKAKEVVDEYGDEVSFREIVTTDPETLREWGILDGLFVNRKEFALGPPLKKKKLRKYIDRELKKNS